MQLNDKDPEHQSIMAKIDRGDIDSCSAVFRPLSTRWSDDGRTILYDEIELYEIGVVVQPAMTAATIAANDGDSAYSLRVYNTQKRLAQLNK